MARMPRLVVPSCPHHVTQRGARCQKTFFSDRDFRLYIKLIAEFAEKTNTEVWAYCLMPNHLHMVMVPSCEDGLRATLAEVHRRYSLYINRREGWQGHLWQERFHSCPMDETHLYAAVRYIEMNPVKANICSNPSDWPWSSARAHLSGQDDALVRVKPMLSRVGQWQHYLSTPIDEEKTKNLRHHASSGRPLGDDGFLASLEEMTGRELVTKSTTRKSLVK